MTPVGETLRRERMKRNLDIGEISRELKISARFLQAIENDQYEKLPGGVFARSFVRQYARLLGLDEEQLAGQMQQSLTPLPELSQFAEKAKPAAFAPVDVQKVDEWQTVGDHGFHWSGWLSAAALVAVMLVCSAAYTWIQHPKGSWFSSLSSPQSAQVQAPAPPAQPVPADPSPGAAQASTEPGASQPLGQGTAATGTDAPEQTAEPRLPEQKPESRTPDPRPLDAKPVELKLAEPKPAAPVGDVQVRVTITADEPVWVLARTDGKYAFSATMDARTTRTVEAAKEVMLRLGNAGGVTISLNGKPIGSAGPKGQVRTLQFTSGGFQIVPAKPPSAPSPAPDRL